MKIFHKITKSLFRKPDQPQNVGKACATITLKHDQSTFTLSVDVTRSGWWHRSGRRVLEHALSKDWITADDGIAYNRTALLCYTIQEEALWVLPESKSKNKPDVTSEDLTNKKQ